MENEIFLRSPSEKEFNDWFEDSCREFADDTAFINKSNPLSEYEKIVMLTNELLPDGKDTKDTIIKVFDTKNSKNCGFIWLGKLEPLKENEIFLFQITISKDLRGQGLGRKLLTKMHNDLADLGYKNIYLNVMKRNYAKNLYESLGYNSVNEYEYNMILKREL